jgi:hypothetical protein
MNKSSRISSTRKNFRTGCRCFAGLAGCGGPGLPDAPGPRGGPDGGRPGRDCGVPEPAGPGGGYGGLWESGAAVPYGSGITRVRSGAACWASRPYSQSRSSSRPGDMSAKVPGGKRHYASCLLSASESSLVGVASAPKPRAPHILAGIFPEILPPQQTERLPRCQFAPRMLHRAPWPRLTHVSSEANGSNDVGA